jgi:ABC-type hemin transport system substrate-binding protein
LVVAEGVGDVVGDVAEAVEVEEQAEEAETYTSAHIRQNSGANYQLKTKRK